MENILAFKELIISNWYKKYTPLALMGLYLVCYLVIDLSELYKIVIVTVILFSLLIAWWITNRLPKAKKEHIGILISFKTENSEQYETIRTKIINTFKDNISGSSDIKFDILYLPRHISENLRIENREHITRVLKKTRTVFCIYGNCIYGKLKNEDNYIIRMNAGVSHKPIPSVVCTLFGNEFAELLGNKAIIPKNNELEGFELYTEHLECVTQYILGTAFLLTGYFGPAKDIFLKLEKEIFLQNRKAKVVSVIKQRLADRLYDLFHIYAIKHYESFRKAKSKDELYKFGEYIKLMDAKRPNNYECSMQLAIYYFHNGRQISKAENEISKCKNSRDIGWRFSDAFLTLYNGNIMLAYKKYRRVFNHKCTEEYAKTIQEFIKDVYIEEKDNHKLCLALGLIDYYIFKDNNSAYQNLKSFIIYAPEHYSSVKNEVDRILQRLNNEEDISTEKQIATTLDSN